MKNTHRHGSQITSYYTMNELTMKSKKKSKDTLKQMKMRTKNPKSMRHSESSPKREIHSITSLPQETRKISNKQSNFTLKGTSKRTINKTQSE